MSEQDLGHTGTKIGDALDDDALEQVRGGAAAKSILRDLIVSSFSADGSSAAPSPTTLNYEEVKVT